MDQVLLIGTPTETKLGQPLVKNAYVEVVVEQQTLSDKVRLLSSPCHPPIYLRNSASSHHCMLIGKLF